MPQVLDCADSIVPPLPCSVLLPLTICPAAEVGAGQLPVVRAEDEEADEDDDVAEVEIIPPTEPLETPNDFDEDDFDDEFDDDFEEEFDDEEFGSDATPDELKSDDDEDSFDDKD